MIDHYHHAVAIPDDFTGRDQDRYDLSRWLSGVGGVAIVHAMGGMGKSTLVRIWAERDVRRVAVPDDALYQARSPEEGREPESIFWWSFYEPDAGFRQFLTAIGEWSAEQRGRKSDSEELSNDLKTLLRDHNILLVLDGFERELRHYAEREDDTKRSDLNECSDPVASDLLTWAVTIPITSHVVLTSRVIPTEIAASHESSMLKSLAGFADTEVVTYLKRNGVEGAPKRLVLVSAKFGHQPLALKLLVGRLRYQSDRNIESVAAWSPVPHLRGRSNHILAQATSGLKEDEKECLRLLATSHGAIRREVAVSAGRHIDRFEEVVLNMTRRGLVENVDETLGMHPIVRQFVVEKFGLTGATHLQIGESLATFYPVREDVDGSVRERQAFVEIQIIHHLTRGGRRIAAFDRLKKLFPYAFFYLDVYGELIAALDGFWSTTDFLSTPSLPDVEQKTYVMTAKANCLDRVGDFGSSLQLRYRTLALDLEGGNETNICMTYLNIARTEMTLGLLERSSNSLESARQRSGSNNGMFLRFLMYQSRVSGLIGDIKGIKFSEILTDYYSFMLMQGRSPTVTQSAAVAFEYAAESCARLGNLSLATRYSVTGDKLSTESKSLREIARARFMDLFVKSCAGSLGAATLVDRADNVLRLARESLQPEFEVRTLSLKACLHAEGQNWVECRKVGLEAARLAARAGMRLELSEAHLSLAKCTKMLNMGEDFHFHLEAAKSNAAFDTAFEYQTVAKDIRKLTTREG